MKKVFLTALIFLLVTNYAKAIKGFKGDEDLGGRSIAKINLYSLLYKTASVQYEYLLPRKKTVLLGVRFTPNRSLPFAKTLADQASATGDQNAANFFNSLKWSGFALTPEFRFYMGQQSGRGFYFAPFVRYESFSTSVTYSEILNSGKPFSSNFKGKYSDLGIGLGLGAQWFLGDHFTLDWMFSGGYFKNNTLLLSATSSDFGLSTTDINDINESLSELSTSFFKFNSTINNQKIELKGSYPGLGLRTALSLGYRF